MAESLKKTKEAADDVMKWAATEYNYLKYFRQHLEELKIHLNEFNTEKKTLRKTKADLRQAGRAMKRLNRYFGRLDKDVKELANNLPNNLRQEELDIEKQIGIAAKSILLQGSRYVGSLIKQLDILITEFDLLEKYKNKPEEAGINKKISNITENLTKEIENMLQWVEGLVAAVKNEESFVGRVAA